MPQKPPAVVTAHKPRPRKAPKAKAEATLTSTRIVTVRKQGSWRAAVPDLSPAEVKWRANAAEELWRELVRRATGKEFKRDF